MFSMGNIFKTTQKKPLQTSTVSSQSVARPQMSYGSVLNNQGPKSMPVPQQAPASQQSTSVWKYTPSNSLESFGQSLANGNGFSSIQKSIQNAVTPPKVNTQPKPSQSGPMSIPQPSAGFSPTQIPGGSQPPSPQPTTSASQPSADSRWMGYVQSAADRNKTFAEEQRKQKEDYIRKQYELLNSQLDQSIPQYQNDFNQFKSNTEAGIADIQASGERQKGQARDYYGDAQRSAAKSRNDVRGQTQRTFANLGTLDSRGEGSFSQATDNQDSEFNRFTQQNLKAQADKLSEIDAVVGQSERQARNTIAQEESKMRQLISQIQMAKQQNNIDQVQALTQAFNESQQYIYDIQDSVAQMKYQFGLEKEKLNNALALQSKETAGLSPEFMQTGEVKNMNDFIYRTKNPGAFGKIGATSGAPKQTETGMKFNLASQTAQQALDSLNAGLANTGKVQSVQSGVSKFLGNQDPSQTDYETKLSAARSVALNALSGAAVSPSEYARLADMIPTLQDEPQIAKQKLASFVQIMNMYGQGMNQTSSQLSQDQIQQILSNMPQ